MNVLQLLYRLGGVTDRATLIALSSRKEVDRALRAGEVVRDGHGRDAVPVADQALRAANALCGVVTHRSAARHRGWEVKAVPRTPDVTVSKNRKIAAERRADVALHRAVLRPDEVEGKVR